MKRTENISILLTDNNFQTILSGWKALNNETRKEVLREYDISDKEMEVLLQLWLGLDFRKFKQPETVIAESWDETIWKLAERYSHNEKKTVTKRLYTIFSKIAAVLIIPIILLTAYLYNNHRVISTSETPQLVTIGCQPGTITNLELPDGSKVWLNAGSTISYPSYFDKRTRNVEIYGEAYFEVVKDIRNPMIVSAGDVQVKVYGTAFNINAFNTEQHVTVTLVKGSVSLSSPKGKPNDDKEVFIKPGQTLIFNKKSKTLKIDYTDTDLYTSWKDGELIFRNEPFAKILERLSRKFNIDIELNDPTLSAIPMDATFREENIDEILRLLASGTPFRYFYGISQKLPDGTFSKGKIYIDSIKN